MGQAAELSATVWRGDLEVWDLAAADRILARCREVVAESRACRLERHARRVRHTAGIARFGFRPAHPAWHAGLQGGAGMLDGVRVLLVTDDADTRDLLRLLFQWYGATTAAVTSDAAPSHVTAFRPDLMVIDLPFARDAVFALAAAIRVDRAGDGGRPRLVALTSHGHDHAEREALEGGFDAQIAEPVDPERFERTLANLLR